MGIIFLCIYSQPFKIRNKDTLLITLWILILVSGITLRRDTFFVFVPPRRTGQRRCLQLIADLSHHNRVEDIH